VHARRDRFPRWADKPSASSTVAPQLWGRAVRQGAPYSKCCASNVSIRHPGERRDPALASALARGPDLDLDSRRRRRAAEGGTPEWLGGTDRERPQPDGGERRRCLSTGMCEFGAGRRPASSVGNRSGFIGPAQASGALSLGYFSLGTHCAAGAARTPKAAPEGRRAEPAPDASGDARSKEK
jgi:hypothetical protein